MDRGRLTVIFSKRPQPGSVKTRLCPPLSPPQAAELAGGMLRDAVERCSGSAAFRTALAFAPPEEEEWFRESFPRLEELVPQEGRGLAERLAAYFEGSLAQPETASVVAIGSDQPTVAVETIVRAHERLEAGADLVLGPDLGGGYYLIGMRASHPELFLRVEMSTEGMCVATQRLGEELGLRVELLDVGYDVDVGTDLDRLREDLDAARTLGRSQTADFPRHTARVLETLFPKQP